MTAKKTTAKTESRSKKAPPAKRKPNAANTKAKAQENVISWIHEYCTKAELAVILDMAMRNVSDHAAKGSFVPAAKNGMFKTLPSIQTYVRKLREMAAGRAEELRNPLADERLRSAQVERELNEIKLSNLRGEMLSAAEVSENWAAFGGQVKAKLLSVPTKVRARIPHMTAHDQETVKEIIVDILNDLADEVEATVIGGDERDVRP